MICKLAKFLSPALIFSCRQLLKFSSFLNLDNQNHHIHIHEFHHLVQVLEQPIRAAGGEVVLALVLVNKTVRNEIDNVPLRGLIRAVPV